MHRPLCCYGRSALAALLFPVAEIAGVSDLGGVELAVLVLGGDGGAGLHGVGVRGLGVIHRALFAQVRQGHRLVCGGCLGSGLGRSFRGVGFGRGGGLLCGIVRCFGLCFGVGLGGLFGLGGVLLGFFAEKSRKRTA